MSATDQKDGLSMRIQKIFELNASHFRRRSPVSNCWSTLEPLTTQLKPQTIITDKLADLFSAVSSGEVDSGVR